MASKKLYKSTLKIEILSDEKIPENASLHKILHETDEGMWSGVKDWEIRNSEIKGIDAVEACEKQGTEPEFFQMDKLGNEIDIDDL
mgnify:CR=1 FL=1